MQDVVSCSNPRYLKQLQPAAAPAHTQWLLQKVSILPLCPAVAADLFQVLPGTLRSL